MLIRLLSQSLHKPVLRNEFSRHLCSLNIHKYKQNSQTSMNNIRYFNIWSLDDWMMKPSKKNKDKLPPGYRQVYDLGINMNVLTGCTYGFGGIGVYTAFEYFTNNDLINFVGKNAFVEQSEYGFISLIAFAHMMLFWLLQSRIPVRMYHSVQDKKYICTLTTVRPGKLKQISFEEGAVSLEEVKFPGFTYVPPLSVPNNINKRYLIIQECFVTKEFWFRMLPDFEERYK